MPRCVVGSERRPDRDLLEDRGSGQPVVRIHGYPLDADSWEKQERELLRAGYRVIRYDRRGFSRSGEPSVFGCFRPARSHTTP
jgi:non-heme chloroperoxidase